MNNPDNQTDLETESGFFPRIAIRDAGRVCFLETREVDWMQASGNYVEIYVGAKSYLQRETMKNLAAKLSPRQFARVHRSTIVNIDRIKELRTISKGQYTISLENGTAVDTNLTLHALQTIIESA